jgi:hypothetical protein
MLENSIVAAQKHNIHHTRIYQPGMLYREIVAADCENLTKAIRKSTVWEKCCFFLCAAVTYSMAVSQEVSCYILRHLTLSFILSHLQHNSRPESTSLS